MRQPPSSRRLLTVSFLLALASSPAAASTLEESIDAYLAAADDVGASLRSTNPDESLIVSKIDTMLTEAIPVLQAFSTVHIQCAEQLNKVIELYPEIATWSALQIRNNIEGAAALPRARGCYPARDVVAHPAIVRANARSAIALPQREGLLAELNEAVEHMTQLKVELLTP